MFREDCNCYLRFSEVQKGRHGMGTATASLIRTRQAAQVLGISEWLLRKMASDGEIKFIQRTDKSPLLFSPADLEKWIQKNKQ